jgi:hypothetical protein
MSLDSGGWNALVDELASDAESVGEAIGITGWSLVTAAKFAHPLEHRASH